MHTVETVKRDLPKVQIKIGKKLVEGKICGRMNKFATVWTKDNIDGWEFSWQIIANALNNDRPLRV